MSFFVSFIGDLHCDSALHRQYMAAHPRTLQLGDLGFNYEYLYSFDYKSHKFVGGNHDNYDVISKIPHYTGDFSLLWNKIVTIRGGFSIDKQWRIEGKDWWRQEELEYAQMLACTEFVGRLKPVIIASHDCPSCIGKALHPKCEPMEPSRTATFLNSIWEMHQPKIWIFGHHHVSRVLRCGETIFHALGAEEVHRIDLDKY